VTTTGPISFQKTTKPKVKPDYQSLGFGRYFTDHMFIAKYSTSSGWSKGEVVPYGPLNLDPGASVLHYGQALFEGLKAFSQKSGEAAIFRPEFNWARMVAGAERLCMQPPPKDLFVRGINAVVHADREWIPKDKGSSLYIRPTLIGTEAFLGVRPAEEYLFYVILSPVGSYYAGGLQPLKIWVEQKYLRAAPGGLGATKAAANYAGSLKAAFEAKKQGYSQVLWLDTKREAIEEVGTMNIYFVFDNEIVTPALDGTILGGGTRDSVATLLNAWGTPVVQRRVTIKELQEASSSGRLKEVFGTGTAAVISPVGELASDAWKITINQNQMGPVATRLYDEITGIQDGSRPDQFGWLTKVPSSLL
jgi:branched-chain amino acid aminotransferase